MHDISIRRAIGGYIVTRLRLGVDELIFPSLEKVFEFLLMEYEGRSDVFSGRIYGSVHIVRNRQEPHIKEPQP